MVHWKSGEIAVQFGRQEFDLTTNGQVANYVVVSEHHALGLPSCSAAKQDKRHVIHDVNGLRRSSCRDVTSYFADINEIQVSRFLFL